MSALLALFALAGSAFSAPPEVPVDVSAPPECAGARSLDAELASCLSVVPGDARVAVLLTSRGPGYTAHIELTLAGQRVGTRVIELPRGTCAEALRSVALAICIALDSAASPWPQLPSGAREPEPPEPRSRAHRDAIFGPAVSWQPAASPDGGPCDGPCPVEGRLQVGASLAVGLTPDTTLAMVAGWAVGRDTWRVEAAAVHLPGSRFEGPSQGTGTETSLDVSWTGASLALVWRHDAFFIGGWVLAGAHAARQRGFEGDSDAPSSPYVAMGGRLGLDVPLLRGDLPIALGLHVDVGGALLRGRYVVETEQGRSAVWVAPAVPVLVGLTLSATLF